MTRDEKMILACIDDSLLSETVCDYASWISTQLHSPLKLLHMINHHQETAEHTDLSGNLGVNSKDHLLEEMAELEHEKSRARIQAGKAILKQANERVSTAGVTDAKSCLQHGSLVSTLIELEANIQALVIGARGKMHEGQQHQIGDKLGTIIRSLHLPILVAYETFISPSNIMLAYNGSAAANKALDMIANNPLNQNTELHIVCVERKELANSLLEQVKDRLQSLPNVTLITSSLEGKPEQALCDYQKEHDIHLTVMGAFTHTRLHDLILGSITEKMLLNTNTPLLLLR